MSRKSEELLRGADPGATASVGHTHHTLPASRVSRAIPWVTVSPFMFVRPKVKTVNVVYIPSDFNNSTKRGKDRSGSSKASIRIPAKLGDRTSTFWARESTARSGSES